MAIKQAVNKSQAVRDYVKIHPAATPSRIATALNQQGIEITSAHVATIKARIYEAAAALPKPTDTLTAEQLKNVAQAINRIRQREAAAEDAAPPIVEKPAKTRKLKDKEFAIAINRIPRKAAVRTTVPPIPEKSVDTLTSHQLKMVARAMKEARSRLPADPDT